METKLNCFIIIHFHDCTRYIYIYKYKIDEKFLSFERKKYFIPKKFFRLQRIFYYQKIFQLEKNFVIKKYAIKGVSWGKISQ